MEKMPKAEEFLWGDEDKGETIWADEAIKLMKEFAKLHVEAALKAAHRNQQLPEEDLEFTLSAYPLTNIK